MMSRRLAPALAIVMVAGCGRPSLPANASPPKDFAELQGRYDALAAGLREAEVAAFLGKPGRGLVGYSMLPVQRKPEGEDRARASGEVDKYWASADWTGAVHAVFRPDGTVRLVELLRLTPTGPVLPRPAPEGPAPPPPG
jgi:hypothetical protein